MSSSAVEDKRYFYRASVVEVYDGDTITVDIDLGFNLSLRGLKVRLSGLDTAEMKSKDAGQRSRAIAARDWLRSSCLGKHVFLQSGGQDKYGRWLGTVYTLDGLCCNEELLRLGHAVPYGGGKKQSVLTEVSPS
jgi:micrococcal nuclease